MKIQIVPSPIPDSPNHFYRYAAIWRTAEGKRILTSGIFTSLIGPAADEARKLFLYQVKRDLKLHPETT